LDAIFVSVKLRNSVRVMVLKATFNNNTVILWLSVLLVVEIGVTVENNRPVVLVDVNQTTIRSQPALPSIIK
jgi:hypothetical protein